MADKHTASSSNVSTNGIDTQANVDAPPPPPQPTVPPQAQNQQLQVSRIAMRAPPFWKENPALWFAQLESQFITNNIVASDTKYHIAVAALETAIIQQVSDVVLRPPANHKYETLKSRLQERFAESEAKRFKKLLGDIDMGDKQPSHLWREMRELAGEAFDDDLLKSLWLKRLPSRTQAILSTSTENMTRLTEMADKIHEVIDTHSVHTVSMQPETSSTKTKTEFEMLCAQVSELTKQVSKLSTSKVNRGRQNTRSSSRNRQRSSSRHNKDGLCWYHDCFGKDAKNCVAPCSFKSEN